MLININKCEKLQNKYEPYQAIVAHHDMSVCVFVMW